MRLAVGFFRSQEDPQVVLRALGVRGYRKSAALTRTGRPEPRVLQGSASSVYWALLAGGITLLGSLLLRLPATYFLPTSVVGFVAGWLVVRRVGSGIGRELIARYSRWLLEQETVVLVQVRDSELKEVVGILREASSGFAATFFSRPGKLLARRKGGIEYRPEALSGERLRTEAIRLAAVHRVDHPQQRAARDLLAQVPRLASDLQGARADLAESRELEQPISQSAEWLLDNRHLIDAHLDTLRLHLIWRSVRALPVVRTRSGGVEIRLQELAEELIRDSDCTVNAENIASFVSAYQSLQPLTIRELWLMPSFLRLALLKALEARGREVSEQQFLSEQADFWAHRVLNATRLDPGQLLLILGELAKEHPRLPPHLGLRLHAQLYDEEATQSVIQAWLERQMNLSYQDLVKQEQARLAARQISIGNAISSLRKLSEMDWQQSFEGISEVEGILRADPADIHPKCDFQTREACRQVVEELAASSGKSETEVAQAAVRLAHSRERADHVEDTGVPGSSAMTFDADSPGRAPDNHVGYYLIGDGRELLEKEIRFRPTWKNLGSRWIRTSPAVVYWGCVSLLTLIFAAGLLAVSSPGQSWTILLIALPLLILVAYEAAAQNTEYLATTLVRPRLIPKLKFEAGVPKECRTAVLTRIRPDTEDLRTLEANFLANRDPNILYAVENGGPEVERAIEELNQRYGVRSFVLIPAGRPVSGLHGIRFVLTVGHDTQLPHRCVTRLAETFAHPLTSRQPGGCRIVVPDPCVSLPCATSSRFARLFSRRGNRLGYTDSRFVTQRNLFGRIPSNGTAMYEIGGRNLPSPVTGLRTGLATDVEVLGSFPATYAEFAEKRLREMASAIRQRDREAEHPSSPHPGFWNDLRPGIISLAAVSLVVFGALGGRPAFAIAALLPVFWPVVLSALNAPRRWRKQDSSSNRWEGVGLSLKRSIVCAILLPHSALAILQALLSAEPRISSRRSTLECTGIALGSICLGGLAIYLYPWSSSLLIAGWFLGWTTSVPLVWFLNQPSKRPERTVRKEDDRAFLRRTARRTWRYFDDLVGPSTHWLPPDSFQEALHVEVSGKTSPTDIGMWLLSALTAWDLGFLTLPQLLDRLSRTMDTLERLERVDGHFLNWYDTTTLDAIRPPYISTADSGTLISCMVVLIRGLADLTFRPLPRSEEFEALSDLVDEIQSEASPSPQLVPLFASLRRTLCAERGAPARDDAGPPGRRDASAHSEVGAELDSAGRDLERLRQLLETNAPASPSLYWAGKASEQMRAMREVYELDPQTVQGSIRDLVERIDREAARIDLHSLYDRERRLFSIGYNPVEGRCDESVYDLLASDARLVSLIAIGRGSAPVEHWRALGRPFAETRQGQVLLSGTGSIQEYLMPVLFTGSFPGSLLHDACRAAVREQINFAKRRGTPWGISESGWSALDSRRSYQYRAFGVPSLALASKAEGAAVISPYSAALALAIAPNAAAENLRRLSTLGVQGDKGFYEAVDYTRASRPEGAPGVVIYMYMAQHAGLILGSIGNVLLNGVVQRRFHSDPFVRSARHLLFETSPVNPPVFAGPVSERRPPRLVTASTEPGAVRIRTHETPIPRVHLMSNGDLSAMVTNSGGGYLRWRGLDITRWRADTTRDHWGSFCYVTDEEIRRTWSLGFHPIDRPERRYSVTFTAERVEFRRRDFEVETTGQVLVAPEDNVELRMITLTNRSTRLRRLQLTTYAELALLEHGADRRHPALTKLPVQTRSYPDRRLLLAWRPPTESEQTGVWVGQMLISPGRIADFEYETDRARFIGRSRDLRKPAALDRKLSGSDGFVLDPVLSLRTRTSLEPGDQSRIALLTFVGESQDEVITLSDKYSDIQVAYRAFDLAWTYTQLQFRHLGIQVDQSQHFQELASHMLFPNATFRPSSERLRGTPLGRKSDLAHLGLTDEYPILLVTISEENDLGLAKEALLAHAFWRSRGLQTELFLLNRQGGEAGEALHERLRKITQSLSDPTLGEQLEGIVIRSVDGVTSEEQSILLSAARAVLVGARGSIAQQLSRSPEKHETPPLLEIENAPAEEPSSPLPTVDLKQENGVGGWTEDGREYVINLVPDKTTPSPWVNVLANPGFGVIVSDSGVGCTWNANSRTNRLTPWSNDPVCDQPGEALYIRDEETGFYWTATPLPIREEDPYRIRHGQGYSIFEHNSHAIEQRLLTFVPIYDEGADPIRVQSLRLKNGSSRRRYLSVTAYLEWVLGSDREETQIGVVTAWDSESQAMIARNPHHPDLGNHVAFAALNPPATSYSADRGMFLGRNRSMRNPAALGRQYLAGRTGAGLDACAAVQTRLELNPGEETEVIFLLGQTRGIEEAREFIRTYRDRLYVEESLASTQAWWQSILRSVEVRTPDPAVDFLINRWLLYQTVSCRLWARTGFHESEGGYVFKDQGQDVLALLHSRPDLVRQHLHDAAGRQFVEGDVQQRWDPESGTGVRDRCRENALWLPYSVSHYVEATGDKEFLAESVPFLEGPLLPKGESEVLHTPGVAMEDGTVFEHCRRAVENALAFGPRGLPEESLSIARQTLGRDGVGSVEDASLGWLLVDVLARFERLCRLRGDVRLAQRYDGIRKELTDNLEAHAWDGEWYRWAFLQKGETLGSRTSRHVKIQATVQSRAVMAGSASNERLRAAMSSVEKHLLKKPDRIMPLFVPPFEDKSLSGRHQALAPGVLGNGAEDTAAAVWAAAAFARIGNANQAVDLLRMLSPVTRTEDEAEVNRYRGEPYAAPRHVLSAVGRKGRAGWTWYSGASAAMYRVWTEEIFGLRREGEFLVIRPNLPDEWDRCEIKYRFGYATYEIEIESCGGTRGAVESVELDGEKLEDGRVQLVDNSRHNKVRVKIGCGDHEDAMR